MTENASKGSRKECSEIKSRVPTDLLTPWLPLPRLNLAHHALLDLLFPLLHATALSLGLRYMQIKILRPCKDGGKKILLRSYDYLPEWPMCIWLMYHQ